MCKFHYRISMGFPYCVAASLRYMFNNHLALRKAVSCVAVPTEQSRLVSIPLVPLQTCTKPQRERSLLSAQEGTDHTFFFRRKQAKRDFLVVFIQRLDLLCSFHGREHERYFKPIDSPVYSWPLQPNCILINTARHKL